MKAKALLFPEVNQVILETVDVPEPEIGEVLIETAYSCISPGTEMRCFKGLEKDIEGWPFIPGYALTGLVKTRGTNTAIEEGTRVFCLGTAKVNQRCVWGGHISHAIQRERNVYPLPENVTLLEGSIAKQAAISYHSMRLSKVASHEHVVIIGLGLLGQLAARIYKLSGAKVIAMSRSERLVRIARKAGIEAIVWSESLSKALRPALPKGANIIVDTTGDFAIIPQAIGIAKNLPWTDAPMTGARYILQGSYLDSLLLPYQPAFEQELSFYFSRDQQPSDIHAVLKLISQEKLIVRDMVDTIIQPNDAQKAYAHICSPQRRALTIAFQWSNCNS